VTRFITLAPIFSDLSPLEKQDIPEGPGSLTCEIGQMVRMEPLSLQKHDLKTRDILI
jgi:hypothetical protein